MYYTSLASRTIPQDEGAHPDAVLEWWYQNAIFETSDTPVSDWSMISTFATAKPDRDSLLFLLFPPGREPINMARRLKGERMQAAALEQHQRRGGALEGGAVRLHFLAFCWAFKLD